MEDEEDRGQLLERGRRVSANSVEGIGRNGYLDSDRLESCQISHQFRDDLREIDWFPLLEIYSGQGFDHEQSMLLVQQASGQHLHEIARRLIEFSLAEESTHLQPTNNAIRIE
jgi:hypothetical protein